MRRSTWDASGRNSPTWRNFTRVCFYRGLLTKEQEALYSQHVGPYIEREKLDIDWGKHGVAVSLTSLVAEEPT